MDFCYVWLRKHLAETEPAFCPASTRAEQELTVNETGGPWIEHFTEGLAQIYARFARALKPGAPFAFTYHHNQAQAYYPIVVSLLDAGLVCTATLPCPAEMGASIHINGTRSSVIDTVFVCRTTGTVRARDFETSPDALQRMLDQDVADLERAGHTATAGDVQCMLLGHMARLAVWQSAIHVVHADRCQTAQGAERFEPGLSPGFDLEPGGQVLSAPSEIPLLAHMMVQEEQEPYESDRDTF